VTTSRGEISRGDASHLNERLAGKVWLAQNRGEWPVTLMTSESQVVTWLAKNPNGAAWEYVITPVRRVQTVNPVPFLKEFEPPTEATAT